MMPTLLHEDTILVDRSKTNLIPNKIVVARSEDGVIVKRLRQLEAGQWLLDSDNPDYAGRFLDQTVEIIGHVVWQGKWL